MRQILGQEASVYTSSCPSFRENPTLGENKQTTISEIEYAIDYSNEFYRFLTCGKKKYLSLMNLALP